jgi:hypothetical protein
MQQLTRSFVCSAALFLLSLGACGGDDTSGPDTVAPTISLSAAVGEEEVVLSADVADDVAVVQVDFVVNGGASQSTLTDSEGRSV